MHDELTDFQLAQLASFIAPENPNPAMEQVHLDPRLLGVLLEAGTALVTQHLARSKHTPVTLASHDLYNIFRRIMRKDEKLPKARRSLGWGIRDIVKAGLGANLDTYVAHWAEHLAEKGIITTIECQTVPSPRIFEPATHAARKHWLDALANAEMSVNPQTGQTEYRALYHDLAGRKRLGNPRTEDERINSLREPSLGYQDSEVTYIFSRTSSLPDAER